MVPAGVGLKGTGRASIEAAMRSPADVSGAVHAQLDDVAVGKVALGRGQIDVSARDSVFRAEVAFPEPRLRISGSGRIDSGGTLTAEAAAPGIDLGPFARALDVPGGLGGTLSARATARVPLAEPRRGEGVLSIDPLRVVVASEAWESGSPIEIRWAEGGVFARDLPACREGRAALRSGNACGGREAGRPDVCPGAARDARRHAPRGPGERRCPRPLAARIGKSGRADLHRGRSDSPRQPAPARSAGDLARPRGAVQPVEPGVASPRRHGGDRRRPRAGAGGPRPAWLAARGLSGAAPGSQRRGGPHRGVLERVGRRPRAERAHRGCAAPGAGAPRARPLQP